MPRRDDISKVMIIGSGPIVIGQAAEFDYSGTQACKALRALGYKIVLVNSNPATIMTDPAMADETYIEPLNIETLERIIALRARTQRCDRCADRRGLVRAARAQGGRLPQLRREGL